MPTARRPGADHLLPTMEADTLIADKTFDADARVLEPLAAADKTTVIPPRSNRSLPRDYDRELYAARHLIENFFVKIKQFRAIATRYEKTARNFLAATQLVASVVWLKLMTGPSFRSPDRGISKAVTRIPGRPAGKPPSPARVTVPVPAMSHAIRAAIWLAPSALAASCRA